MRLPDTNNYELNLSIFQLFLCLCKYNRNSKFKRILNAYTHNIRITNADGQAITKIRTAIKKLKMGMTQKSKIYEFAVDLFVHLSEIAFKYSILAK